MLTREQHQPSKGDINMFSAGPNSSKGKAPLQPSSSKKKKVVTDEKDRLKLAYHAEEILKLERQQSLLRLKEQRIASLQQHKTCVYISKSSDYI